VLGHHFLEAQEIKTRVINFLYEGEDFGNHKVQWECDCITTSKRLESGDVIETTEPTQHNIAQNIFIDLQNKVQVQVVSIKKSQV
jgi:hypothetical protein